MAARKIHGLRGARVEPVSALISMPVGKFRFLAVSEPRSMDLPFFDFGALPSGDRKAA